jgi:23S rRNA (uridine2552-2'-O)-methyltransferase
MPKKTESQQRWLRRQHNDPYVKKAREEGYRSRAAYKLKEIQEKYKIIRKGVRILDLGAAPGSWSQVALEYGAHVTGIDLLSIDPLEGVVFIQGDFLEIEPYVIEKVDGILSDLSPSTCGVPKVDHLKLIGMLEDIVALCPKLLKPKGFLVCKVFKGGMEGELLKLLKKYFSRISHMKPKSSRKESPEEYLIAQDFKLSDLKVK